MNLKSSSTTSVVQGSSPSCHTLTTYPCHRSLNPAHALPKKKRINNKSFIRLPPDADSLHQHCLWANYLAHLVHQTSLKRHPTPWLGAGGWSLSPCPPHLPAPGPAEEIEEDGSEETEEEEGDSSESDDSESSEAECCNSDWSCKILSGFIIQLSQFKLLKQAYFEVKLVLFPHRQVA